ncbi:hypothetical protein [Nonomuraea sp. NPDC049141]|uniref:hypothetical protein n=1 Tax=Nonomuraea sp. NPDC049141 TaxID=3155500 RepID=UPI0033F344CC
MTEYANDHGHNDHPVDTTVTADPRPPPRCPTSSARKTITDMHDNDDTLAAADISTALAEQRIEVTAEAVQAVLQGDASIAEAVEAVE